MKTFKNLEKMQKYYNKNTNTYEFVEDEKRLDVKFEFDLVVSSNIFAGNINTLFIDALNIDALNIDVCNIDALNINALDIDASNINAGSISARNINAVIIDAYNIKANNIKAINIKAHDIDAQDINYYAVCFAYNSFKCKSVKGRRKNSKHFCLDREIEYIADEKNIKEGTNCSKD